MRKIVVALFLLGIAFIGHSWAAEAHVHGHASLQIILGMDKAQLHFRSPAANILGFEHEPDSEQQRQRLIQAINTLKQGDSLFDFANAHCSLSRANVSSGMKLEDEAHHGHEEHHDEDQGHSDFEVEYEFQCVTMDSIEYIDVNLFDAFPGVEEIDAILLSGKVQRPLELTTQQRRIHLD